MPCPGAGGHRGAGRSEPLRVPLVLLQDDGGHAPELLAEREHVVEQGDLVVDRVGGEPQSPDQVLPADGERRDPRLDLQGARGGVEAHEAEELRDELQDHVRLALGLRGRAGLVALERAEDRLAHLRLQDRELAPLLHVLEDYALDLVHPASEESLFLSASRLVRPVLLRPPVRY